MRMRSGDYVEAVAAQRREKDDFFKHSRDSPIPAPQRAAFTGLAYYDPDPRYRVHAVWHPEGRPETVRVGTSTGEAREYLRAGRLAFVLDGKQVTLAAYVAPDADEGHLFVPFRDATSGSETYGAGRYLDLPAPRGHDMVLDFNLAYSPTCAYNEDYSCPFPPHENWLDVPIPAGEKAYEGP